MKNLDNQRYTQILKEKNGFLLQNWLRCQDIKNPQKAIRDHCKIKGCTNRSVIENTGFGQSNQKKKYINEGNLYRLIIRSKIEGAEEFESWIFDEILPMIRRTGAYISDNVWD